MVWSIDLKTRDTPWNPAASLKAAILFGTHVARPILAGGHVYRRQQTGHMIASKSLRSCSASCKRGPSTYGFRARGVAVAPGITAIHALARTNDSHTPPPISTRAEMRPSSLL
jgi:hypothetical protein